MQWLHCNSLKFHHLNLHHHVKEKIYFYTRYSSFHSACMKSCIFSLFFTIPHDYSSHVFWAYPSENSGFSRYRAYAPRPGNNHGIQSVRGWFWKERFSSPTEAK